MAFLDVNTLVMTLEICLADESLVAAADEARERILALLVVGLEMRLVIVAATEELATPLNRTLVIGLFLCCMLAVRTLRAYQARGGHGERGMYREGHIVHVVGTALRRPAQAGEL